MIDSPRFFEARAMVSNNICFNKTEGMTFPRFLGIPIEPQPVLGQAYVSTTGMVGIKI